MGALVACTTADKPINQELAIAQQCGAIGDLEVYAAGQRSAGKLTAKQISLVDAAVATADPLCSDPSATAANPAQVDQLRAVLPAIAAAVATGGSK
jgi:hypothetical protein